jgi:hypothetical protein
MVHAKNLYDITVDAVWHDKWCVRRHKLTDTFEASASRSLSGKAIN